MICDKNVAIILYLLVNLIHIVQEGPTGLNVVTMKTGYTMISFRVRTTKNYTFENTFHQPFLRYGNPDLLFLGTLKIKI